MLGSLSSDSDEDLPTLDDLFKPKASKRPSQQRPPSPHSLNNRSSKTSSHELVSGDKPKSGAHKLHLPPAPLPSNSLAGSPSHTTSPGVPIRSVPPASPTKASPLVSTPRRDHRPRPQGATSAELLAGIDSRTGSLSSIPVVHEELLVVECKTDTEGESSSRQADTTTEDEISSEGAESSAASDPSSDSSSSCSPPSRTHRPADDRPAPSSFTPASKSLPSVSSTPTQFPQTRYRPKGFAIHQGYQADAFFDFSAYVVIEKRDTAGSPIVGAPSVAAEDVEVDEALRALGGRELERARRRVEERRIEHKLERKEVIPPTESEGSSSNEEFLPLAKPSASSAVPVLIDLISTPKAKSRRAARPTELFGAYTSTPLGSTASSSLLPLGDSPVASASRLTPASPFIDFTESRTNTPRRRKKAPRPTELFQFITREKKLSVVEGVASKGREHELRVIQGTDGKAEGDTRHDLGDKRKRTGQRVERRKSGKGCWDREAVEEVRAVEGEEEGEPMGNGLLTLLDKEVLGDLGSHLPTCVASTPKIPIDLDSPLPPFQSSATLTQLKGGRRLILDSDDELDSPSSSLPATSLPPFSNKGKSRQALIHDLSDPSSSSSDSDSPPFSRELPVEPEDDFAGVLSFSPPPRPTFLPSSPHPQLPPSPAPHQPLKSFRRKPTPDILPLPRSTKPPLKLMSKAWKTHRATLALKLVDDLDVGVFDKKVKKWLRLEEGAEGKEERKDEPKGVVWTGKLRTTAGMSRWSRKKCVGGQIGDEEGYQHFCRVELSAKVLNTDEKIISTTAHELCHLATWIFSGKDAAPHGKEFKAWAKKVNRFRPDIVVTTRHDYEITHKFTWKCAECDASYGRDSRSIDPARQCCGKCNGRLVPQHPEPSQATPSKPNPYRDFLKEHFRTIQASSPGATQGEVMRVLAERWRVEKLRRVQAGGVEELVGGLKGLVIELD